MKKVLVFLILSIGCLSWAFGQSVEIRGKTRRFADAVWIRWQPGAPEAMKKHMLKGFNLERVTISRDGQPLPKEERYRLNEQPIKFDTAGIEKDNAELQWIKQMLFYVKSEGNNPLAIVEDKETMDLAFMQVSVLLMRDFNLAIQCGLGWQDQTAKLNEEYVYTVSTASEDTARVYLFSGLEKPQPSPKIQQHQYRNKRAVLGINTLFSPEYFGYTVERALDSQFAFKAISNLPFVHAGKGETLMLLDTPAVLAGKVFYRVSGLDMFGLPGPYSDTVFVYVLPDLECPQLTDLLLLNDSQLHFKWPFPDREKRYFDSLEIMIGRSADGLFQRLDYKPVGNGFTAAIPQDYSSIYLQPSARDLGGEWHSGGMAFLQKVDSLPPPPPSSIIGSCDSLGIVKLNWKASPTAHYYRIYRANNPRQEYSDYSHVHLTDTFFTDTINLKMLQDSLYYAISALDERYNQSRFSYYSCAVFDIIPPPAPAFSGYRKMDKGYELQWQHARASDVQSYTLIRWDDNSRNQWQIRTFAPDNSLKFIDTIGEGDAIYQYAITASDARGNISKPSAALALRFPVNDQIPAVSQPTIVCDTLKNRCFLFWEYPDLKGLSHFSVLLKSNNKSRVLGTTSAAEKQLCVYGFIPAENDKIKIVAHTINGLKSK